MKRISVIIPVFNHEGELRDCLLALQRQTRRPLEVIVVDDGSERAVRLDETQYDFPLTFIRFEKNQGAPKARNTGFENSKGEYVIFLDADATLEPLALEKMQQALESSKADFVYSGFYWGRKLFSLREFDAEALKKDNYIHTSALMHREAFPGFDESLKKFQDWDLFLTMAANGKVGEWINEPLFRVKPRKSGMSHWMPAFVYDLPWRILPFKPKTVKKYMSAKAVIQEKHSLPVENNELAEYIVITLLGIFVFELISFAVVHFPQMNSFFAVLFTGLLFAITFSRPPVGLSILVAELMIGSKGALFKFAADAENNGGVSIRMMFFAAFLVAWALKADWKLIMSEMKTWIRERLSYVALAAVLVWAFVNGVLRENPFLLQDANAWGFLILLLPVLEIATTDGKTFFRRVLAAVYAGIGYVTIKTIFLFYLFSHPFGDWIEVVYYWVRKSGVGEITRILEGASAHRVFFQSHIFEVLALAPLLLLIFFAKGRKQWGSLLFVLSFATILISFSRSFLLGAVFALAAFKLFLLTHKKQLGSWASLAKRSFLLATASVGLVLIALFFPIPPPDNVGLSDTIAARFDSGEAAVQSRWQLLPILWDGILDSPILGQGFGSTVTYTSEDPRVVETTGGEYTTYAFEWGWLDFWFKFGILGIPIMLYVLISLGIRFRKLNIPSWLYMIPVTMLLTLAVIHGFTPYLNHPLGFITLILLEGALVLESKHHLLSKKYAKH